MSYYKPSGKFNPILLIPGLLVGILLTIALAYLYILLGSWISFIIVKLILLLLGLFVVLEITKLSNRIAKNRNKLISFFLVFVFSSTLLYFSWVFFVVIELKRGFLESFQNLDDYVLLLFNFQEYQVRTPLAWFADSNGAQASGLETYVVLGLESLLLFLGPIILFKIADFDAMLYCEKCNVWTRKIKTLTKEWSKDFTTEQVEEMIVKEDLSELLNLPDVNIDFKISIKIFTINLYCCPKCKEMNYIKIEKSDTKKSESKEKERTIKEIMKSKDSNLLLNYYRIDSKKLLHDINSYKPS